MKFLIVIINAQSPVMSSHAQRLVDLLQLGWTIVLTLCTTRSSTS